MISVNYSPLRYPGGKSKIAPLMQTIIDGLALPEVTYIEPFAGGAGVALNLLLEGHVNQIVINDYDKAIYSFWRALIECPEALIAMVRTVPLTVDEWRHQKEIYTTQNRKYSIELGFAALYLNRTNRSGILNAGPIGGYDQTGTYGIDARFYRETLIQRIEQIAQHRQRIKVYNKDIRSFIDKIIPKYQQNGFVYFDPPYYVKGQRLYKNSFSTEDHAEIAQKIINGVQCPWVITYDDVPELRNIYGNFLQKRYYLNYSAANKGIGSELIIFKEPQLLPAKATANKQANKFHLEDIE